jgi:hypothetical protein
MEPMQTDELLRHLARRYVWWRSTDEALAQRTHLLCQVLQLGTADDVRALRGAVGDDALRAALQEAPPGVLDPRSWNYWHLVLFGHAGPPMPERPLP